MQHKGINWCTAEDRHILRLLQVEMQILYHHPLRSHLLEAKKIILFRSRYVISLGFGAETPSAWKFSMTIHGARSSQEEVHDGIASPA